MGTGGITKETYTQEEYLALDAEDLKCEFDGAQVYAMAGAGMEHVQVAGNVLALPNTRLAERRCRVMQSDLCGCASVHAAGAPRYTLRVSRRSGTLR